MKLPQSLAARLLIAALCVVATQAAVWQLNRRTGMAAVAATKIDVRELPMQIGHWTGAPVDLDPKLFDAIGALTAVNRSYIDNMGRHASVHLTSHVAENMAALLHLPTECYPAHGWVILKNDWQSAGDRRFRMMIVEQSGVRAAVVYWYQLGEDIVSDRDELRPIMQKLRRQGRSWPPVVKVMIQVTGDFSDEENKSPVEGLDSEIYKWVLTKS